MSSIMRIGFAAAVFALGLGKVSAATLPDPLGVATIALRAGSEIATVDANIGTLELQREWANAGTFDRPGDVTVTTLSVASAEGYGAPQPLVVASADASVSLNGSSTRIGTDTRAIVLLTYEFRFNPLGVFNGLFDELPIDFDIRASLNASASGGGTAGGSATAQVYLAEGTLSRVGLVPTADADDRIFSSFVSASTTGADEGVAEITETVERDLATSQVYSIQKYISAIASAANSGSNGSMASTQGVLDPLISISQQRFEARYASECAILFGAACPDAGSLFALELSEGIAPVPVPASAILLSSALLALAARARRRRA